MALRMERLVFLLISTGSLLSCTATPHQAYRNRQCRTELVTSGAYDAECFLESEGGPEAGHDGHSKIFEPPFRDFLRGLIVVTGAINPDYTRTYGAPLQRPKSTQPDTPPALDKVPPAPPGH